MDSNPNDDSGLIDILAMQREAAERAAAAPVSQVTPSAIPVSEVPPPVTRDTGVDFEEFALAINRPWTKRFPVLAIGGALGGLIAVAIGIALLSGDSSPKPAVAPMAAAAPAPQPSHGPDIPPPPVLEDARPMADTQPISSSATTKHVEKAHRTSKQRRLPGVKLMKVKSSGT